MQAIVKEVRVAFRQLGKTPGFTLTVVLALAVGIGATTAIFSLVEGILLRPLPFSNADRLVLLGDHLGNNPGIGVTAHEIGTYTRATHAFSTMGGFTTASYEVSNGADQGVLPEEVHATRLNASVFPTLGIQPLLGRTFSSQEDDAHQPVAVISYTLWLNRYHRDQAVLGNAIVLDRRTYTIIGVMPRSFEFPLQTGRLDKTELWIPLSLTAGEVDPNSGVWAYHLVGRLRQGVTERQAAQDVDRVAMQIMHEFPPGMSALHIRGDVRSLRENTIGEVRPVLRTLFLAVSVVLLIACFNVAGLLLVRAIRRRREYAVRLALGARSSVIVRQSVAEGLLLSLAGGAVGLGLAAIAIRTALHLLPESMPRIDSISMDARVVVFALLLAVATGALCSVAPAIAALHTNLLESLKEGSRSSAAASHSWLRSSLVVLEIAIALVLLTVSGAFLRSFRNMCAVDPGFRPDRLLVAHFQLPLRQYPTTASEQEFDHAVLERLSAKPGVVSVGLSDFLPATDFAGESSYTLADVPTASWKLQFAVFNPIYGDYFRALSIPVLEGRTFTADDRADTPPVIIVNQSMAKHCWPGQSALGKRLHPGNPRKKMPWAMVVGVVADTKGGARDEPDSDQFYLPAAQPATLTGTSTNAALTSPASGYISLRSALPPEQLTQVLRSTVAQVDPLLALQRIQTMSDVVSNIEAPRRFNTDLITGFAAGALLLAITGIYAVVAFSVSLRGQEIAIRMVLGAKRQNIARLVLLSGVKLALVGCLLGIAGSLAVFRLVQSFLFEVSATDPVVYGIAICTMLLLALLASAVPAFRAASADPIQTLRAE